MQAKTEIIFKSIAQLGDGAWLCGAVPGLPIQQVDDGFLRLTGYTREELERQFSNNIKSMIDPRDREKAIATMHAELQTQPHYAVQYRLQNKAGEMLWVQDRGMLVQNDSQEECVQSIIIDITAHKKTQQQLHLCQLQHNLAMELSGLQALCEANITTNTILWYNADWLKQNALPIPKEYTTFAQQLCADIAHPDYQEALAEIMSRKNMKIQLNNGVNRLAQELTAKTPKGYQWQELTISLIYEPLTEDIHLRCYLKNIEKRKEKERKAQVQQQNYQYMLARSAIVYNINVTANRILGGHENWQNTFGVEDSANHDEMLGVFCQNAVHPEDRALFTQNIGRKQLLEAFTNGQEKITCQYRRAGANGKFTWVSCTINLFEDPETSHVRGFVHVEDIHAQKSKELDLLYRAQHDALSGFYNKATTEEKINAYLATSEAKMGKHAFFIVDVDKFKAINDNFGHSFGDTVLRQVCGNLRELFREDDIMGRIGGDEFVVLMKNIQSQRVAISKAAEMCATVRIGYNKDNVTHAISLSIGLAYYSQHGRDYQQLYCKSDKALYHAKQSGRDRYSIYNPELEADIPTD